ncbi:unnamed protein product [Plutella xylostella]|uniref:(diamondback moth) hypothetical protein n=1 Tax=Plutella xylostella TaxID=51655 RepID=A0A8S4FNS4_PLUXY|nr:unnamed protein product [Plutella xylostella]
MLIKRTFQHLTVVFLLVVSPVLCDERTNRTNYDVDTLSHSKVLSRRKRFLIFPEGSSFQLVFCITIPALALADIFLYGYTAALAWELPQDPYSPFDHKADPLHRRVDTKQIYFTDYDGKVLFKKPYKRRPIVNPAIAKRSVNSNEKGTRFKMDRKRMHTGHKRDFLKTEHMDERSVEFHRSSRASLYEKIEGLLKAMGANGRSCLLKTLCQVGQTHDHKQSSFLQEIMRTVFTLPKGKDFEQERHQEYDSAHSVAESCDLVYPDCETAAAGPVSSFTL